LDRGVSGHAASCFFAGIAPRTARGDRLPIAHLERGAAAFSSADRQCLAAWLHDPQRQNAIELEPYVAMLSLLKGSFDAQSFA
jgi:hypothetical protein